MGIDKVTTSLKLIDAAMENSNWISFACVQNTYVQNTYVQNTYVQNTYVRNTYVQNTCVQNTV